MRYKTASGKGKPHNNSYYENGTCNTIDDLTGFKIKMSDSVELWNGLIVQKDNYEPRQPQDFPPEIRPNRVFKGAKDESEESVNVYTPPEDITQL